MKMRTETDPLGAKQVPADAYYGVESQRAVDNFPISGLRLRPEMVAAVAQIKAAAARAHMELGELPTEIARPIIQAAQEVAEGRLHDQFVVDAFQAGAGTSFHMNANEVIANRALELTGRPRGDYQAISPHDHVNMGQSTNDVFPTAIRLAGLSLLKRLEPAMEELAGALRKKEREFGQVLKSGRTHLQDAVPVTLGQEFGGYAVAIEKCRRRIAQAGEELLELGLGASAVGTGLNNSPQYRRRSVELLSEQTGFRLRPADNYIELTQNTDAFLHLSGALRTLAADLIRIANDLRLLSSGPATGLAEIELPPVQPGSSMMPGKVNPVIAEMVDMVGFQVMGNDLAVSLAVQAGQLELNVMMPLIAHNLCQSLAILTNAVEALAGKCVSGIRADPERCREMAERSLGLATALSPRLGYLQAARLAQESLATGRSIAELAREQGLLSEEELKEALDPARLTGKQVRP